MEPFSQIDADKPLGLEPRRADRLGFRLTAKKLAITLADRTSDDGWVLGIEGRWGSGKSTLTGFVVDELAKLSITREQIIVFSPWLIGTRDALIDELVRDIGSATYNAVIKDQTASREIKKKARKLKRALEGYSKSISRIAGITKEANAGGIAGAIVAGVGGLLSWASESPDLLGKKESVVSDLKSLGKRIFVFIDDLDRLEPTEVIEVLRLVRSVADFPNVTYVISYDPEIVCQMLEGTLHIQSGAEYLKKFVQATFKLPIPSSFALTKWFREDVASLFEKQIRNLQDEERREASDRLATELQLYASKYLHTPRDVIRALNALRLYGLPVADEVDIADLVCVQLLRFGNPKIHEWIEAYMRTVAAINDGAYLGDAEIKIFSDNLKKAFAERDEDAENSIYHFERLLPGITTSTYGQSERFAVFKNVTTAELTHFIRDRRLGSPHHYRLFFALALSENAISDDDMNSFVQIAISSPVDAASRFSTIAKVATATDGDSVEQLLDRLRASGERIPTEAIAGIIYAMAEGLDDVARNNAEPLWGRSWSWVMGENILFTQLARLQSPDRKAILGELFEKRSSLGWLINLLRGLTSERKSIGAEKESTKVTDEEYEFIRQTVLRRLASSKSEAILNAPRLLSALYGWQQAGGDSDVRHWFGRQIETDDGFLELLSKLRGVASVNDKTIFPLQSFDLNHFTDAKKVQSRLEMLSRSATSDRQLAIADQLLRALHQGDDLDHDRKASA